MVHQSIKGYIQSFSDVSLFSRETIQEVSIIHPYKTLVKSNYEYDPPTWSKHQNRPKNFSKRPLRGWSMSAPD